MGTRQKSPSTLTGAFRELLTHERTSSQFERYTSLARGAPTVRTGPQDFLSLKSPPGILNLPIVRRRYPQGASIARSPFWWSGKCASWERIDLLDLPGGKAQVRPFADFGFAMASPMWWSTRPIKPPTMATTRTLVHFHRGTRAWFSYRKFRLKVSLDKVLHATLFLRNRAATANRFAQYAMHKFG